MVTASEAISEIFKVAGVVLLLPILLAVVPQLLMFGFIVIACTAVFLFFATVFVLPIILFAELLLDLFVKALRTLSRFVAELLQIFWE